MLLLARHDLGAGWRVTAAAPRSVPPIACGRLHLRLRGAAAHPVAAASPTYTEGSSGPFVAQTAYVYANGAAARQVWRGVARAALLACLADSFVHGAAHGVTFTVTGQHVLPAPKLAVKAARFQVDATATSGTESVDAYLEVLLFGHGNGVTELSFSSLVAPPAPGVELRVARAVAARLDEKTR